MSNQFSENSSLPVVSAKAMMIIKKILRHTGSLFSRQILTKIQILNLSSIIMSVVNCAFVVHVLIFPKEKLQLPQTSCHTVKPVGVLVYITFLDHYNVEHFFNSVITLINTITSAQSHLKLHKKKSTLITNV